MVIYFLLFILILKSLVIAMPWIKENIWRKTTAVFRTKALSTELFYGNSIDAKSFFVQTFKQAPCMIYVGDIDVVKAFAFITGNELLAIRSIYQRNYYAWEEKKLAAAHTIFKLQKNFMIEVGDDYAKILYPVDQFERAKQFSDAFVQFKALPNADEPEICIINIQQSELCLKKIDIKPIELDIELYYNNDFKAVDAVIRKRLLTDNDKGIVLLHGLPGTGKTTYLRYLIRTLKKKVLFLSPSVAGNLANPEFMDLLIDNSNCILVIEDAENIIMDRRYNSNSSVSNLLNISDGLLSDCLNVQIVCTFNSALNLVDEALMRKGRLIARYEFGRLETGKAQALSDHLGCGRKITKPMTLAEITNPDEVTYVQPQVNIMGFRRELIEN